MNKPATADALLTVGSGTTLYIGTLEEIDWHHHGAPVFVSGLAGTFRLRLPNGCWITCQSAVIPAGVRHALDVQGDPLAVFYPEPTMAMASELIRLMKDREEQGGILVGSSADYRLFRELYEDRDSIQWSDNALQDLVGFVRRHNTKLGLDVRLTQVLQGIQTHPDNASGVALHAATCNISPSRFLHLFKEQTGVPFRRYRIWSRVRRAMREALSGQSFTEAAITAGFSDSAHFSRSFRETFGVTPSYAFSKIARTGVSDGTDPVNRKRSPS